MPKRSTFSREEADSIRELLKRKARAKPADQKILRGKLRRLGFWIDDYALTHEAFGIADFERLIRDGVIHVIESTSPGGAGND